MLDPFVTEVFKVFILQALTGLSMVLKSKQFGNSVEIKDKQIVEKRYVFLWLWYYVNTLRLPCK